MIKPKIILDFGVNHEGNMIKVYEAIGIARNAGVDAIKFQHYNPEEFGKPDHLKLSFDNYKNIAEFCKDLNFEWGISLFDSTWNDIAFFNDLGVRFFKVAACQNKVGILDILKKNIPDNSKLIMSYDVTKPEYNLIGNILTQQAIYFYTIKRGVKIDSLICNPEYPCFEPPLHEIAESLGLELGYSCHTPCYHACIAAQMLGAPIIEKHFTLDHNQSDFRDHKHALDPDELREWMHWVNYYVREGE